MFYDLALINFAHMLSVKLEWNKNFIAENAIENTICEIPIKSICKIIAHAFDLIFPEVCS